MTPPIESHENTNNDRSHADTNTPMNDDHDTAVMEPSKPPVSQLLSIPPPPSSSSSEIPITTTALSMILGKVQEYKDLGNRAFQQSTTRTPDTPHPQQQQHYQQQAIEYYTRGIDLLLQERSRFLQSSSSSSSSHSELPPPPHATTTATPSNNDNTAAAAVDAIDHPQWNNLLVQLYSNRSLVYIKCQQYLLAEQDCHRVLDDHPHHYDHDPRFISKVWYRRGWAREQYAAQQLSQLLSSPPTTTTITDPNVDTTAILTTVQQYLEQSKRDLQQCLYVVNNNNNKSNNATATASSPMSEKEIQSLKQQVIPVVQRLALLQKQISTTTTTTGVVDEPTTNRTTRPSAASATSLLDTERTSSIRPPLPSHQQQRTQIRELLTNRAAISNGWMMEGEAYFLLHWTWWCHFCHYVQLFDTTEDDPWFRGVPPGATRPDPVTHENAENDDDRSPGPIDNTSLLLLLPSTKKDSSRSSEKSDAAVDRIYNQHWYRPYYDHININNVSDTMSSTTKAAHPTPGGDDNDENPTNGHHAPSHPSTYPIVPVRPNLERGYHYEIIPREVYYALRLWYTEITPPICRRAMKGTSTQNGNSTNGHGHESRLCIPLYPLRLHTTVPSVTTTPSVETSPTGGSSNKVGVGVCGNCGAVNVTLRCYNCLSIYYCDRSCQESDWNAHKNECKMIAQTKSSRDNLKTTLLPSQQRLVRARGRTGLNNLGNTCFMNAAIQCLSHATPLTRHFLSGRYQMDINRSNPLGTGGQLAAAYADTIKSLHHSRTTATLSIIPSKLKHAIAMFAPRFAGFLQHDAQEFLAYLLDGLHEDVNRIRNAPYVEMPDVTDGQCIAIAGAKAWDAHRKRNDSIVLDTFYGQFKSTCVCPKCHRVSVSFDVFNHVSLEIPQDKNDNIPMVVILFASPSLANPFPKPTRYAVSIRRNTDIVSDLKHALSAACQTPFERLHICEQHHGTITIHEDKKALSTIRTTALLAYEFDPLQASEESDPVFHTVLTNQLVVPDESSATMAKSAQTTTLERIGLPILTSFNASYTCREVWNHVWSLMDFYVSRKEGNIEDSAQPSPMDIDNDLDVRRMLQIRLVVEPNGKERPVFPIPLDDAAKGTNSQEGDDHIDGMDTSESEIVTKGMTYTSVLPMDSDETLLKYVGIAQLRNFVFFDCVWLPPQVTTSEGGIVGEEKMDAMTTTTTTTATPTTTNTYDIDEDRFYSFIDHSSYLEFMKKSNTVASKKVVTLDECFDTFTRPERLDVQNMWYCSNCKDHVQALKTMELWKLPNVLIIHLKRFEYKHSLRRDKLDHLVDFPLYGLDMNQHCGKYNNSNNDKSNKAVCVDVSVPAIYDCFAVVNHYGRMGGGHYTAFARSWNEEGFPSSSSATNTGSATVTASDWNIFDDSHVSTVRDERQIISSAAYVLLYRRRIFH